MVVPLGPGKFYGSSLPRPHLYSEVKYNPDRVRVDPPVPVTDALMSWANEAHWSMGGLSFKRLRLQGRIEGNVNRLRKQKEKEITNRINESRTGSKFEEETKKGKKRAVSESPPPAPKATKRRKLVDLFEEESEREEEEAGRRKMVRKLVGDFERVAKEKVNDVAAKVVEEESKKLKGGKKSSGGGGESGSGGGIGKRSSPRLAKHRT